MESNLQELENIRRKCVELDGELNTFLHSIREIRSIRDSVAEIPDKLKEQEAEIEHQKVKIENMLSSTSNLLITFEEQAKGLFFDLEKKTDTLAGNVKTSISELRNIFELNRVRLQEEQKEKLEQIIKAYDQIQISFESVKNTITLHEQSITALQNNYAEILKIFEKSEKSFHEIKKSLSDLQKRPYEADLRMKAVEDKLRKIFFTKLDRQKNVVLAMLFVMISCIIFLFFYLR
jgi:chromosome segregation ATPase